MKENLEGNLSVQSSDPTVLAFELLPAREVTPEHSCVPPLDVKVTALAPGNTDIIVLRDGEPHDRLPLEVLEPKSLVLEASGSAQENQRFCAPLGSTAALIPTLFDADGKRIGYAAPGYEWEIGGAPAGNHGFNIAAFGTDDTRVTVRWGELSDTVTLGAPCP